MGGIVVLLGRLEKALRGGGKGGLGGVLLMSRCSQVRTGGLGSREGVLLKLLPV